MTDSPGNQPWPGLFTPLLHRVSAAGAARPRWGANDARFGLADCGAVCTPPHPAVLARLAACPRCYER